MSEPVQDLEVANPAVEWQPPLTICKMAMLSVVVDVAYLVRIIAGYLVSQYVMPGQRRKLRDYPADRGRKTFVLSKHYF